LFNHRKTTLILKADELGRAADILRSGGLVVFPTETVFGLGADATNPQTVAKIFEAKGRPSDNPLIVHLASTDQLPQVVRAIPEPARRLMDAFWPGPLTLVLPKNLAVPQAVTAGLDSVAVRIPNHPLALELLRLAERPIAAPSANRSGRPSGTRLAEILEDLEGRVDAVVVGPNPPLGLESSVVDVSQPDDRQPARLLRSGSVTLEQLRQVLPDCQPPLADPNASDEPRCSPGLRHPHYQPRAEVRLFDGPDQIPIEQTVATGPILVMALAPADRALPPDCHWLTFDSLEAYAAELYAGLRHADRLGAGQVWCQRVPEQGLGRALMDRLGRAAAARM
jgi:L-threonylcarbamoyladenylate synthase